MKIIISALTLLIGLFSAKAFSQSDPAKERFDEYTKGLNVTDKKQDSFETPDGSVSSYTATVHDQKISESPVSDGQVSDINRLVSSAPKFVEMYAAYVGEDISPQILDLAFSNWRARKADSPFDAESVIFIVGAAFGEYCNRSLNMKWVMVDDAFGQDIAIRFKQKAVYGYPFSMVEKRINTTESGFLAATFLQLEHSSKQIGVANIESDK